MLTDIEIAHSVVPEKITEIARKLDIPQEDLMLYGDMIAKVKTPYRDNADAKLILVTSINPTSAGNGKTTVSIGLADAMAGMGKKVCLALREPSMGPVFGIKGGATGGGFSQVIPMEDINLHFTGDFHAITSANNLLASIIDNHIFQGNALDIDEKSIVFNRCMDLNDRALRNVSVELSEGVTRKDKFNITAASEVMAIACVAKDIDDLKARLGNILVATTKSGSPVYARDLHAQDAMAIILKNAIMPNLVQTLNGTPALIHLGPFANIAHGCNSLVATNIAMQYSNYTITEAGFGADLGAEKFIDFKCRLGGIKPNCVVIVATIPALKLHGGVSKENLKLENLDAIKIGFDNLQKHIDNMTKVFHTPVVVTLNRFSTDTDKEIELVTNLVSAKKVPFAVNEVWAMGGNGAKDLAKAVLDACDKKYVESYAYDMEDSIEKKIESIAYKIYGAKSVQYTEDSLKDLKLIKSLGYDKYPVIMAKTQYSLSDNKDLVGAPQDFDITVRSLEIRSGAGFVVVCLGKMLLMPGLNKTPAYMGMKIDSRGDISGMY